MSLCLCTSCLQWQDSVLLQFYEGGTQPDPSAAEKTPDQILFDRAMEAMENQRFDIARLTLETLVNTYPDSDYATKAREALQDPRINACRGAWSVPPSDCNVTPDSASFSD